MKQLNSALGIASFCTFLFYLSIEVSPLETDLQNLASFGYVELLDGKVFLTLLNKLSHEDVKTIQRIDSLIDIILIEPVLKEEGENLHLRPREPP